MIKRIVKIIVCLTFVLLCVGLSGCSKGGESTGKIDAKYEVNCSLDDINRALYVTSKASIFNDSELDFYQLPFYLYPNAYVDRGGSVQIGNVSSNGDSLVYSLEDSLLTIKPNKKLGARESMDITFSLRVGIPNCSGRLGYGDDYYNLHGFFPRLAYFNGDEFEVVPYTENGDPFCFSFDDVTIKISYPSEYTLASGGEVLSHCDNDGSAEDVVNMGKSRNTSLSLVKKYEVFEGGNENVKVTHFTKSEKDYTTYAVNCLEYFTNFIGECPLTSLVIVEVPYDYLGMEYDGLIIVDERARDKEFIIAHEVIHQWFGIEVGSNSYDEPWVNESITNFLTYYYMDIYNKGGYGENIEKEKTRYKKFIQEGKEKYGVGYAPRLDQGLGEFRTNAEYVNMVYGYGVLLYDGLRDVVGERKMQKSIGEYYKKYKGSTSSGNKLMESFSKCAGKRVDGIFESYIENRVSF